MRSGLCCGIIMTACLAACSSGGPTVELVRAPAVAGADEAADPAIARDPLNGDWLLAWVAGDSAGYHLYFARSNDEGATWSMPVRVTDRERDIKPHAEASPRMVVSGGGIALFWPNNIEIPGRRFPASNMRFSRSGDGGRSWSAAVTLNDDTARAPAGHTFHGATARGDTLIVAWLDSRVDVKAVTHGDTAVHHEGDATIYTARSNDSGMTWSAQNGVHWGAACPCCRVSLATAPDGSVVAAWRGHFDGSVRDPVVATLAPAGEPARVRADGWVFHGCPHTGPALAIDAQGARHVAWFTGREGGAGVFYARSNGPTEFGDALPLVSAPTLPAAHPAIAVTNAGPIIAINLDERGQRTLTIATVRNGRPSLHTVPNTDGADHPQLTPLTDGALVAWTERASATSTIRLARIATGS